MKHLMFGAWKTSHTRALATPPPSRLCPRAVLIRKKKERGKTNPGRPLYAILLQHHAYYPTMDRRDKRAARKLQWCKRR